MAPLEDTVSRHLTDLLKPRGYAVIAASREGQGMLFECGAAHGAGFTVWLSPADNSSRAFQRGQGFLLGYRGEPPPAALEALRGLATRLRALERTTSAEHWFDLREPARGTVSAALIYGQTRLEMRVTLRCNERCLFCNSSESVENLVASEEEALALLAPARNAGAEMLVLTGGEPLLVPWLPAVAQRARELGFRRITLQTNGVLLAQSKVWERLQQVRPDELLISVHGPTDQIVGEVSGLPGLLEPKQKAIVACVDAGYRVAVSFVLCRQNMTHAAATMDMLATLSAPPQMVAFSCVAPSGAAIAQGRRTIPTMTEAAPQLLSGLQRAEKLGLAPVLVEYCGMPTCISPALRRFCEPFDAEHPLGVPSDKQKLPVCPECAWDHRCSGIFTGYLDLYGVDEFMDAPAAHREVP